MAIKKDEKKQLFDKVKTEYIERFHEEPEIPIPFGTSDWLLAEMTKALIKNRPIPLEAYFPGGLNNDDGYNILY